MMSNYSHKHIKLAKQAYHRKADKLAIALERATTKEQFNQAVDDFFSWKQLEPKPDKQ